MILKKLGFLLFSLLLLQTCSVFSPVKVEPNNIFVLNKIPYVAVKRSSTSINLLVTQASSNPLYNSSAMAYSIAPYQVNYFALNSWATPPAQMINSTLVQTLQNTHYFHSVSGAPAVGQYDYILNVQLVELRQEFCKSSSQVHLTLLVQLINMENARIIATKRFSIVEPTTQKTPFGGVAAANRATAKLLKRITEFCINRI